MPPHTAVHQNLLNEPIQLATTYLQRSFADMWSTFAFSKKWSLVANSAYVRSYSSTGVLDLCNQEQILSYNFFHSTTQFFLMSIDYLIKQNEKKMMSNAEKKNKWHFQQERRKTKQPEEKTKTRGDKKHNSLLKKKFIWIQVCTWTSPQNICLYLKGRAVHMVTHFGLQVGNRGSIPLGLTPGRVNLVIARGDKPRALALGAGINISPQARGRILEKTPFCSSSQLESRRQCPREGCYYSKRSIFKRKSMQKVANCIPVISPPVYTNTDFKCSTTWRNLQY